MAGSKTDISETSTMAAPPVAKEKLGARIGAHWKKWWWIHAITLIGGVLIIVLPVVYVGYPRIAQRLVHESTLNITHMAISDPTPDSFHLAQTQVISSGSSFHPMISSFAAAVSLSGVSVPFGIVHLPQVKAEDGAMLRIDQSVHLSDASAFKEFVKATMLNEVLELNVYGKTKLKEGALPKADITYNKTVGLKGLNKLDGFKITEFKILAIDGPDGTNTRGTVYIPNPTVMTINLGNVTMDLAVNSTHIGQSFMKDLTLHPGNNTVPITSKVDKMAVLKILPPDGMLRVGIRGNSSVYHGQELEYFSETLRANTLHATLDVGKALM